MLGAGWKAEGGRGLGGVEQVHETFGSGGDTDGAAGREPHGTEGREVVRAIGAVVDVVAASEVQAEGLGAERAGTTGRVP